MNSAHFKYVMESVAEHLMEHYDNGPVRRWHRHLGWALMIGAAFVGMAIARGIVTGVAVVLLLGGALGLGIAIWKRGREAWVRRIVTEHLCFRCGYPLEGVGKDGAGFGGCPECGRRFCITDYVDPE
jgi:hypothetical protein